ncbi:hypothetical protein [Vibrio vulnificus]|uniref:hypothetical protein n=1 Tax=Vibrio vulnificus TaxID=672 RepID=UPI00188B868B|nr:hypothetical protein [Vibrio vulnificus]MBF4496017.1 hypothetical protein [Vibrio vulnificus]
MTIVTLKLSEAENVLRKWFEAGVAYNLIFGSLEARKQAGVIDLRRLFSSIPLTERPYYYEILKKAFDPRYNTMQVIMSHLDPTLPFSGKLQACVYILGENYPQMSFQLFNMAATSTSLDPKEIVRAYYLIRAKLDRAHDQKQVIEIKDKTLVALSKLVNQQQLTSSLVHVEYGPSQDSLTPFIVHSYDLFTHQGHSKTNNEMFNLGKIHEHYIEIARKHALGQDPLEEVPHPLLAGKKYTQWAPILHALCRHYESSTSVEYYRTYSGSIPIKYDHELDNRNVTPQFDRLRKRELSLRRFLKPHPDDFAQRLQEPLEQIDPTLVRKMVLCNMIMFYFSVMNNAPWYIQVRECIAKLKKRYPQDILTKLICFPEREDVTDDTLLNNFKELFDCNPVGLFPWMFWGYLPEPIGLMEHYFGDKNNTSIEHIAQRNMSFKKLGLAQSVLLIPKYLNEFDSSQWLKEPIMVKYPSDRTKFCVFYAPENLSKEKGLYLAGLLCKGQYIEETLKENLNMEVEELEDLLLGICYLWHNTIIRKISLSKFLDTLQSTVGSEISERTLRKRVDKAKYWLEQWPKVAPLHENK